jgi:uncharacterized protein (DUF302 family)
MKKALKFLRELIMRKLRDVGLSMQDEEVLFFGNPKIGTTLINESPYIGIELPLKILAWRDKEKTLVAYQDLDKLAEIFRIKTSLATINMLKHFMEKLINSHNSQKLRK